MKPLYPIAIAVALAGLVGLGGCTNPKTPAGHEGYVYYKPLIFTKLEYRDTMRGPASTGVSWRLFVENIDMRERNYLEEFNLLSKDDLNVSFEVNTRLRLRPGTVKEVVEQWGGAHWYEWNVKEPLRTIVRNEVMQVTATRIQLETERIGQAVRAELEKRYEGTPIDVLSVDIGQFQFPPRVTEAIQEKIATHQELQRQAYVLASTEKEAAIGVIDAVAVAKQQHIIGETLDPLYVQRRAVQVYRRLAESPNRTVMVLPNSADAVGMPQVLREGRRRVITAADERLLEEMEEKYSQQARAADALLMGEDGGPSGAGLLPEGAGLMPDEEDEDDEDDAPAPTPPPAPAPTPAD
jgi:regulator of protease activity HflC (stomatin/prohibitin superfamily)